MRDFLSASFKRHRGWPWPVDSFGLTPMFGEGGWCHSCGVPNRDQSGPLLLQRSGLRVAGVWQPYWMYDVICLERSVAEEASRRFDIELGEVGSPRKAGATEAMQVVVPTVGPPWFDPTVLTLNAIEQHGSAGATCPECGVWRWMPLPLGVMPPPLPDPSWVGKDVLASPEWFGDGWNAFREVLVSRPLGEFLAKASPRDFKVEEVESA